MRNGGISRSFKLPDPPCSQVNVEIRVRVLTCLFQDKLERLGWLVTGVVMLAVTAWLPFASFAVAVMPVLASLATCLALLAGTWFYTFRRVDPNIATALVHIAQMTLFTAFGSILSYMIAANELPLWDATLFGIDGALGLDWRAYLTFVNERPLLGLAGSLAYQSLIPQMIVLIAVLSLSGRLDAVRRMMLAAIVTGTLTVVMSGLMPAMAMFVHLGLTQADFPNLKPAAAFVHLADLTALRAGTFPVLDISRAEGIVTFPSYHAALGLILLVGGWAHPWLRWPFLLLNLMLIAATPIDGGHYFIDVAAGLSIAAMVMLVIRKVAPRTTHATLGEPTDLERSRARRRSGQIAPQPAPMAGPSAGVAARSPASWG
jgi:hypothetical protein